MRLKPMVLAIALVATAVGAILYPPIVRADTPISEQLLEETGPTGALGGGDHLFVRFGSDAAFGIVYGTTATPNNIYIVALKARYLGVAQVVDAQDRSIAQNRPIKIYTLYAVKLDSILEFRDGNNNGVADYGRMYDSTTNRFSDYFNRPGDTLYKKVDLHTNWTASPIVRANGTGFRSWTVNLTAGSLSYGSIANSTGSLSGNLPTVRFGFHLNASLTQVDNTTVPQWKIVVDSPSGPSVVTSISRMADLFVSGKAVQYNLKWDQDIDSWTYDANNTPASRRRLLLELGAIVGNLIPAAIVDAWFHNRVLNRMGETGVARFNTSAGPTTANDTTGPGPAVRPFQSALVEFGANWTRIGRFLWTSDSIVDGTSRPVFGQIVTGVPFWVLGERGDAFVGFALLIGLSFRGGASITHDPTVATDIQADLALPASSFPGALFIIAVVGGAVLIGTLLLLVLLVLRRRRKDLPPNSPPAPPPPDD
jgi:hypothetical protein